VNTNLDWFHKWIDFVDLKSVISEDDHGVKDYSDLIFRRWEELLAYSPESPPRS
jgi:hypothetical protein